MHKRGAPDDCPKHPDTARLRSFCIHVFDLKSNRSARIFCIFCLNTAGHLPLHDSI